MYKEKVVILNKIAGNNNPWKLLLKLAGSVDGADKISNDDLQKMLKNADKNNDGLVALDEFKETFLSSEEYMELEEEYLAVFEKMAKFDNNAETISKEDITAAIEEYNNQENNKMSFGTSGSGYSGSSSLKNNDVDLSNKELPELKLGRSEILKEIDSLRTQKSDAITQTENDMLKAQEGYDEATKAFADNVKQKMEANQTTNKFAKDVVSFEDQKNTIQSDISKQKGVISTAKTLISTINSDLSSLVEPPETISFVDEKTQETVNETNPAYADYLSQKEALEAELAAAEQDLIKQEEILVGLEEELTSTETLLQNAITSYAEAETAEGKITSEETIFLENIDKQNKIYQESKLAKKEVMTSYDKEMDALQTNLLAFNDEISEKELELPEGYGIEKGTITNGKNNLSQIAEDTLPQDYKITGNSIEDKNGNVVGMVVGSEKNQKLYIIEEIEKPSLGETTCYYSARLLFEEVISGNEVDTLMNWAGSDFKDLNSKDVKQIEKYYNKLVQEYNSELKEDDEKALNFAEEASKRYANNEETKTNYEAIVNAINKLDTTEIVRPNSFEEYLNKNNVEINSASNSQMSELLDKFMNQKYGDLYNEEYYPALTNEQISKYIGDLESESLENPNKSQINQKINKILSDEELTPYQQVQLLEKIKSCNEEIKNYVNEYFKQDDTFFYNKIEEMISKTNDVGQLKYSQEDILEFVKQYKNLDNTSTVMSSKENLSTVLSLYENAENNEQLFELNSYLKASVLVDYVQQNYQDTEKEKYTELLFKASLSNFISDDGKLSTNQENYKITEDEAANLTEKYINTNKTLSEKAEYILSDLNNEIINKSSAQYLMSKLLGGKPENISGISSIGSKNITSQIFDLYSKKPYQAFGSAEFADPVYIKDGDYQYGLIAPKDIDPNEELPLIVYLPGGGEYKGGSFATVGTYDRNRNGKIEKNDRYEYKDNAIGSIVSDWDLQDFNGYIIIPTLNDSYIPNWFNENAEKYVRGVVQSFQEDHNVNSDMIFVGGNSLGGQGALYMAEHVDDVFSKAFVMSAYADEVGRYDVNNIDIPTIGYVGKSYDFKTSDSGYMDSQFASKFGDENLVKINRAHGKVPINAFRRDADANGKSDLIEWLLEDKVLPENSDEY